MCCSAVSTLKAMLDACARTVSFLFELPGCSEKFVPISGCSPFQQLQPSARAVESVLNADEYMHACAGAICACAMQELPYLVYLHTPVQLLTLTRQCSTAAAVYCLDERRLQSSNTQYEYALAKRVSYRASLRLPPQIGGDRAGAAAALKRAGDL
jgi:hypothetical protein